MPAPRGWIAGPYVWSYNGLSVGITQDGFNLNYAMFGEKVTGDNLGDSTQDYVYRGLDVYADGQFQEWDVARLGAVGDGGKVNVLNFGTFWPWANFGFAGQIGRLASLYSAPLVGVSAPGTTAATTVGAVGGVTTVTLPYGVIPPGYNLAMTFAARHRTVPIRFQALPSPTQANVSGSNATPVAWVALT